MKRLFTSVWLLCVCLTVAAQHSEIPEPTLDPESCTSIMVGKKASTDGSVITSHTCDGGYRTWMDIVPAATYPNDTIQTIYTGRMHTEYAEGARGMIAKGTIPEAKATYQFLNTAYPCLNEKQLGIGETTITGRKELVNKNGMFMIEELERIALQRCTTAREAIQLMGQLIKQYGYGDWGECLTIADPKEVWHFEVFGEGPDKIGGVWAAIRIPDDEVGVSANIPRISAINLKDKENCMASDNVFEAAKRLGYWDGKEPFCFWKAYGGGSKAYSVRELFILNKLAPSLGLTDELEELPFTVKPEKPVAVTDVMALLTETYEGTEQDMTQNLKVTRKNKETNQMETVVSPAANPWMTIDMVDMLNGVKQGTVNRLRLVAVPQCSYSTVIQLRDWLPDAIGGVAWVAFDNPGESPRVPIFSGTKELPACFKICGQHRYREDAAIWTYRRANKLATARWGLLRSDIESARNYFVEKGQTELPFVENRYKALVEQKGEAAAKAYLTDYTSDFAGATLLRWREMGDSFWHQLQRGF